jgi:hypothetical protein
MAVFFFVVVVVVVVVVFATFGISPSGTCFWMTE